MGREAAILLSKWQVGPARHRLWADTPTGIVAIGILSLELLLGPKLAEARRQIDSATIQKTLSRRGGRPVLKYGQYVRVGAGS